jgi:hypothetical protein
MLASRNPSPGKAMIRAMMAVFLVAAVSGCASTPEKPLSAQTTFSKPVAEVQKAAVDALVVNGFDIDKSEPLHVQGSRPHKMGLFVGSGGETVGVWLEPIEPSRTGVRVDTARSFLGIVGQKRWDDDILTEMKRALGREE